MKASEIYFETLGEAIRAFVSQTYERGGTLEVNTHAEIAEQFNGGVSYGTTVSKSFALMAYKHKPTKKWAHISLYRMESGRYELTSYIL